MDSYFLCVDVRLRKKRHLRVGWIREPGGSREPPDHIVFDGRQDFFQDARSLLGDLLKGLLECPLKVL